MKKYLLILFASLLLFSCGMAEETPTIPEAQREQADYAAYLFFNISLPEDTPYQEVDFADPTIQIDAWEARISDPKVILDFQFDEAGRLTRISYIPLTAAAETAEIDPDLTHQKICDLIGAHFGPIDEANYPFSNPKTWHLYAEWITGSNFIYEIICGPGDARYDNCVTSIHYNLSRDEISHVVFTYLD